MGGEEKQYRKPLGQYYLIGWGVPLIICGITAGASLTQYSSNSQLSYSWCSLSLAPAAGAVLVPLLIILIVHLFFVFAIFSLSSGSKTCLDTQLVKTSSQSTLVVTDCQHSPTSHTRVLLLLAILLTTTFSLATLRIITPLPAWILSITHQHLVFSLLYCLLILLLSGLVLVYYCLARQDVVHCRLPLGWGVPVQDETSNLVDLTKPLVEPKLGYPMLELGGSVLGPSTGPRLKQCNLERDSEGSSDYHSVNNSQHLSRPRPGGQEDEERDISVTDIMFGPSAKVKVNNVNIHVAEQSPSYHLHHHHYAPPTPVHSPGYIASSPLELPYPDIFLDKPSQPPPLASASLPRRQSRPEKKRTMAHSDVERVEIYSSSRFSEVSSSTCASLRSRQSRSKKNKPRRKPRKRSEVFPTSSSGSGSKRGKVTQYDPIMEVSLTLDDDEDLDEEHLLVSKI